MRVDCLTALPSGTAHGMFLLSSRPGRPPAAVVGSRRRQPNCRQPANYFVSPPPHGSPPQWSRCELRKSCTSALSWTDRLFHSSHWPGTRSRPLRRHGTVSRCLLLLLLVVVIAPDAALFARTTSTVPRRRPSRDRPRQGSVQSSTHVQSAIRTGRYIIVHLFQNRFRWDHPIGGLVAHRLSQSSCRCRRDSRTGGGGGSDSGVVFVVVVAVVVQYC
jgi:hypothetical protein